MPDSALPLAPTRRTVPGRPGRVRLRVPLPLGQALKSFGVGSFDGNIETWLSRLTSGPLSAVVPGGIGDTEEIQDPYLQAITFSSCVDLRMVGVLLASPRLWDRNPDDPNAEEVTSGPVYDLLQRMNPWMDALETRVVDILHQDLGNESLHLLLDANGNPVRSIGESMDALIELPDMIVPIRGDRVNLECDPVSDLPMSWAWRKKGGESKEWPVAAAVLHGQVRDQRRPYRFVGPLATVIGPANMRHLANRYQSFLMRNDGMGGGWMEMEGPMPGQEEVDRATEHYDQRFNDPENAGATHLVWGGKLHDTGGKPKDLAWSELHDLARDDITAKMGVPKALLGEGTSNYATFQGEWNRFIKLTIRAWLMRDASTWNRFFFGRLRDPKLRQMRLRYDTEVLDGLFADSKEQAEVAAMWTGAGLSVDEAARQVGVKTDPVDGGDVPMIALTRTPLLAGQLLGQARAAKAAQDAGMDKGQSWELAGVKGAIIVEPPPEPEPPALPSPPALPEPPAADDEKPSRAPRRETRAPQAAAEPPLVTRAGEAARDAARKRLAKVTRPHREKMVKGVRRVFREMRNAQLEALERFAETGELPEAEGRAALYAGPAPVLDELQQRDLLAAWRDDVARGPVQVREVTCQGRVLDAYEAECWDMRRAWGQAHDHRGDVRRCLDLVLLQRATLTEDELDQLIVLNHARWLEALTAKVLPITIQAYTAAAKDLSAQLGVDMRIDVTNQAWLDAMKAHAVQVVEGTDSVLAARMRSDIIQVLADKPTLPTLQETIRASLEELKASTTRAFADHHARALAIARTETGNAASSARSDELLQAYEDGVISAKEWFTSGRPEEPDGTVRSAHYAMEGVRTTPGVPYSVDGVLMQRPHDQSAPARLVVNCECGERGVLDDEDDDD